MRPTRTLNWPYLITGVLLLVVAAVTAWDASTMRIRANFGVGADAASYLVAGMLVLLAVGHFIGAVRGTDLVVDEVDWRAIGWVGLGLASLIGMIWIGGGFILAAALLFAFTARAFGRKAFLSDFAIGFVVGLLVYLLFHVVLTLALPAGPLERLI